MFPQSVWDEMMRNVDKNGEPFYFPYPRIIGQSFSVGWWCNENADWLSFQKPEMTATKEGLTHRAKDDIM